MLSFQISTDRLLNELCFKLVESGLVLLEVVVQLSVLGGLHEVVLSKALAIFFMLAGSSSLSKQVFVSILNVLLRLSGPVVRDESPQRCISSCNPKDVISLEGESVYCHTSACKPGSGEECASPDEDACRFFVALLEADASAVGRENLVQLVDFVLGDVSEQLPVGEQVYLLVPVSVLDGVAP